MRHLLFTRALNTSIFSVTALFLLAFNVEADDDEPYTARILLDEPVAYWSFDAEGYQPDVGGLAVKVNGKLKTGGGAIPPEFPLFTGNNRALVLPSRQGYLRVTDPGDKSPLDFDTGDSITLEAWIAPQRMQKGGFSYIVGKGRTNRPGFSKDNHNWALRLKDVNGSAALSFLFRSRGKDSVYHRWTSRNRLGVADGWHHVALVYTFGKKDSLRGYIDGELTTGTWDLGGATTRAPVVDNDEVWIGSALGGQAASTFQGQIDELAIYRRRVEPERLQARFRFEPEPLPPVDVPAGKILVQVLDRVPDKKAWRFRTLRLADSFVLDVLALPELPNLYSARGVREDRSAPFLIRAHADILLPPGKHRLLFRSRDAARLSLDGRIIAETPFYKITAEANGPIWELDRQHAPNMLPLKRGDRQGIAIVEGDGRVHRLIYETLVGLSGRRPEMGEACVAMAPPYGDFTIVGNTDRYQLTESGWSDFVEDNRRQLLERNKARRDRVAHREIEYWRRRHEFARDYLLSVGHFDPSPAGSPRSIDDFVDSALQENNQQPSSSISDLAFLRRLSLDTVGTIPSREAIEQFLGDPVGSRRALAVERLLDDPGWADHWVAYWQDVLAENPNIVNPSLNNTGPFRWWIYSSFWENKAMDRFVTELIRMEGSRHYGGPGGFGLATENDVPFAAKAHVLGQAFLGIQMQCARCHDAPNHDITQRDLFSLAAMLKREPEQVPKTSSINVPDDELHKFAVAVTLKPGEKVEPNWAFQELTSASLPASLINDPQDSREQVAALFTIPQNERFAQIIANRLWQRYLGRGLVEPVHDWEGQTPSHPQLLRWLGRELIGSGYDLKQLARLIFNSQIYQRETVSAPAAVDSLVGPAQRALTAEQLVDSLFVVSGKRYQAGLMAVDIDGARPSSLSLNLGSPRRAWMFASTSNERDRPSLALPFAQPFISFMEQFGWRGARPNPINTRPDDLTALQPAEFANGVLVQRVTRLSDDHAFTQLATQENLPLSRLMNEVYLRIYTRYPSERETEIVRELLAQGFPERRRPDAPLAGRPLDKRGMVSWSNHLEQEASSIKLSLQAVVRQGDPPSNRLESGWRERLEDIIWSLVNSPEFRFAP